MNVVNELQDKLQPDKAYTNLRQEDKSLNIIPPSISIDQSSENCAPEGTKQISPRSNVGTYYDTSSFDLTPLKERIDFTAIQLRCTGPPSLLDISREQFTQSQKEWEYEQANITGTVQPLAYPPIYYPYLSSQDPLTQKLLPAFSEKVDINTQISKLKHVSLDSKNIFESGNSYIHTGMVQDFNSQKFDNNVIMDNYSVTPEDIIGAEIYNMDIF